VAPESTVVFYGYAPYLGFWLMDRHGHERIRAMDGPREMWEAGGHPWSTEVPEPRSSPYERRGENLDLVVGRQDVREMIGDPETVLMDVRSKKEFTGEGLRRACQELGVDAGRRVVTYCTIGNRASQIAFALKQLLGYPDVAVYGSWSEWGSLPDTPVET
jgi:thiosulfate/3-mercaptopyruvate sulfurtransferase